MVPMRYGSRYFFKVLFLHLNHFFHDELDKIYSIGPFLYFDDEILEI